MSKELLKSKLEQAIGTVVFTKADGSERTMKCTLKADLLPVVEIKEGTETRRKAENSSVLSVWDLENSGWRSFKVDSVLSAEFADA